MSHRGGGFRISWIPLGYEPIDRGSARPDTGSETRSREFTTLFRFVDPSFGQDQRMSNDSTDPSRASDPELMRLSKARPASGDLDFTRFAPKKSGAAPSKIGRAHV